MTLGRASEQKQVEQIAGGFKVLDGNEQALAYIYARERKADADIAHGLATDEARRIVVNVARLPELLNPKPLT